MKDDDRRSTNRHYKKVKNKKKHPASKCKKAKCGICHPHKKIGGNNKAAIKLKYRNILKD